MKTKKAIYKPVIQKILGIKQSAYYEYYKNPEKQLIINFLQQFSPYALNSFIEGFELQQKFFKVENSLFAGYKNFVNTLENEELHDFKNCLSKSKKYQEFEKKIKETSPYLYLQILDLNSIYKFENIYNFKEDILNYIDNYLSLSDNKKLYLSYDIGTFIAQTLGRLNLDKFQDEKEVIKFIYDEIRLMYKLNIISSKSREVELHFFRQDDLTQQIEDVFKRVKPTFFSD